MQLGRVISKEVGAYQCPGTSKVVLGPQKKFLQKKISFVCRAAKTQGGKRSFFDVEQKIKQVYGGEKKLETPTNFEVEPAPVSDTKRGFGEKKVKESVAEPIQEGKAKPSHVMTDADIVQQRQRKEKEDAEKQRAIESEFVSRADNQIPAGVSSWDDVSDQIAKKKKRKSNRKLHAKGTGAFAKRLQSISTPNKNEIPDAAKENLKKGFLKTNVVLYSVFFIVGIVGAKLGAGVTILDTFKEPINWQGVLEYKMYLSGWWFFFLVAQYWAPIRIVKAVQMERADYSKLIHTTGDSVPIWTQSLSQAMCAIGEETFYRGFIQLTAANFMGAWGGIAFQSIAFAFVHGPNPLDLIFCTVGGFIYGVGFETYGMTTMVTCHFLDNLIGITTLPQASSFMEKYCFPQESWREEQIVKLEKFVGFLTLPVRRWMRVSQDTYYKS